MTPLNAILGFSATGVFHLDRSVIQLANLKMNLKMMMLARTSIWLHWLRRMASV